MNQKFEDTIDFQWIKNFVQQNLVISIIIAIVLIIVLILLLRHIHIRKQYSKEAWKIVKKNGRKAIFWYDEYGNKTYKKPTNNPNRPNPPKRKHY